MNAHAVARDAWGEHLERRRSVMARNMRSALRELHAVGIPGAHRPPCAQIFTRLDELQWARGDAIYEQGMRDGGSPELAELLLADEQLDARRRELWRRERRR